MRLTNERRAQPRAPLSGSAVVFVGDTREVCDAVDISAGGIAVLAETGQDVGRFLRVNFSLGAGMNWYDADGVVTRVDSRDGRFVWGVQFVVVEETVAREIHDYVDRRRMAGARAKQAEVYTRATAETPPAPETLRQPAPEHLVASPKPDTPPSGRQHEVPGFPGGPKAAPITGEYAPPDSRPPAAEKRVTAAYAAANGDSTARKQAAGAESPPTRRARPRHGLSGRPLPKPAPKPARPAKPPTPSRRLADEPIDRELLNLYLQALRDLDDPKGRKKKKRKG